MTRLILAVAFAFAGLSGAALAATGYDADGDGLVTFNEMLAAMPSLTEETFSTIDANGDGAVDADELVAAQESGVIPAAG
ncbi:MAG: EF-hand domain-containing protein [Rhodobacteraceae bacterium]|nr:EF-hand domain-containing protein [Paracoccaceae bacterium]NNK68245.1 EF-hand domain-containing protein [Paracoccaceae bacterium]